MKKIIEKNLAELIIITVFALAFSSCSQTTYLPCAAYANSYGETEGIHEDLTEDEYNKLIACENCDEID
tara:strand:+ start:322 stop:528 length:207 start_codon:yes stop_codon:yes gene_type:complete